MLSTPPTGTPSGPDVAPFGTVAVILVDDHAVKVAVVPLNRTVLAPCVAPKPLPAITTLDGALAAGGVTPEMEGGTGTVNVVPALGTPLTVTRTGPVEAPAGTTVTIRVAIQLVIVVTGVPLNVTVLVP